MVLSVKTFGFLFKLLLDIITNERLKLKNKVFVLNLFTEIKKNVREQSVIEMGSCSR